MPFTTRQKIFRSAGGWLTAALRLPRRQETAPTGRTAKKSFGGRTPRQNNKQQDSHRILGCLQQMMMMSFICSCRNKNQPKAIYPKGLPTIRSCLEGLLVHGAPRRRPSRMPLHHKWSMLTAGSDLVCYPLSSSHRPPPPPQALGGVHPRRTHPFVLYPMGTCDFTYVFSLKEIEIKTDLDHPKPIPHPIPPGGQSTRSLRQALSPPSPLNSHTLARSHACTHLLTLARSQGEVLVLLLQQMRWCRSRAEISFPRPRACGRGKRL